MTQTRHYKILQYEKSILKTLSYSPETDIDKTKITNNTLLIPEISLTSKNLNLFNEENKLYTLTPNDTYSHTSESNQFLPTMTTIPNETHERYISK